MRGPNYIFVVSYILHYISCQKKQFTYLKEYNVIWYLLLFQVQKQLQLIKSVCDSMLQQQSIISQPNANVQHLRNNLTPSPLYSEPQSYPNPNAQALNMVNVANQNVDVPWFSGNPELNNYQGWLATNTIQTQSFMLNTLNQCCQMLWLQQRELVSLRNVVSMVSKSPSVLYHLPDIKYEMNSNFHA